MHVLLVEDDAQCAAAFVRFAGRLGFSCVHLPSLAAARRIDATPFDAWVVDDDLGSRERGEAFLATSLDRRPRAALWTAGFAGPAYFSALRQATVIAKTDLVGLRAWLAPGA